ncbi:hypothetical protein GCM10023189_17020 [Nibrella saemangeumensis]|uniref:DUF4230 domain-containing protein n=1 Tax=Nibrella saemangeumensis TaxID=1084526 RepID=A0ABP8MMJ6_9BACT
MDFTTIFLLLLTGGAGGATIAFLLKRRAGVTQVRSDVTLLLERIEKVFKVVMAEGYFSEIFNYQDQKKIFYLLDDPKKAIIIAKAKVLVGFDFSKVRFRQPQPGEKKLIIEYFPEPEVLSIDTDYKFYDIFPGLLNHFSSEDYTKILDEAKQAMHERALQSDLPRIANNQIQYMIYQLSDSMGWQLELPEKEQKKLEALTRYDDLKADPKYLPELGSGHENPDKQNNS